jgi:hypothetical protein
VTQPLQNTLLFRGAFTSTAAAVLTGCTSAEAGIAALGVGLAAAGGWAAYRYLSRIRGETASPAPPPVVLAREPSSRTLDATRADIPQAALTAIKGEIERLYPILAEDAYAALSLAIAKTILKSRPAIGSDPDGASLEHLIRDQVASLVQQLRARTNTAPTERLLRELESPVWRESIESLSTDGIHHPDERLASLAAQRLAEMANTDHFRLPMLPLVGLRLRAFSKTSTRKLAADFIHTLAQIAAPSSGIAAQDRAVSEQALRILFADGLTHSDPWIASAARIAINSIRLRRPEIFSDEMLQALAERS